MFGWSRRWTRRIPPVSHTCANGRSSSSPRQRSNRRPRAPRIRRRLPYTASRAFDRPLPAPTAAVRLRDVAAQAQRLQVGQGPVAVVAFVAHHFFEASSIRLNRLELLGRHDQRLDHRRRVARVSRLHRNAHDRPRFQVRGVLGLVGQVRVWTPPRMQAFSASPPWSATTERRRKRRDCSGGTRASFPAGPQRVSRTVGRGSHPERAGAERRTRASGLTVVVDRARGGRAPSEGLRGSVHTVRCCRVSGLIDCGTSTAAGPYGDTRVESKSSECARRHVALGWFSRPRLMTVCPYPRPTRSCVQRRGPVAAFLGGTDRYAVGVVLRHQRPGDARHPVGQRHGNQHARLARQHPGQPRVLRAVCGRLRECKPFLRLLLGPRQRSGAASAAIAPVERGPASQLARNEFPARSAAAVTLKGPERSGGPAPAG